MEFPAVEITNSQVKVAMLALNLVVVWVGGKAKPIHGEILPEYCTGIIGILQAKITARSWR